MSGGRRGVFLDRDGTLNEDLDYIQKPGDLHLIAGVGSAVQRLNACGLVICVISNQSGIARGFLTEKDLVPIHKKLEDELAREGGTIDRIYYCPHHPTEGTAPYKGVCNCRKPKIGMLLRGAEEFGIDLTRSFVVGDSVVDMQAGNTATARTILVLTGYGPATLKECTLNHDIHIDHVAPTIVEAVDYILTSLDGENKYNA